jgi:hypothetical protein
MDSGPAHSLNVGVHRPKVGGADCIVAFCSAATVPVLTSDSGRVLGRADAAK